MILYIINQGINLFKMSLTMEVGAGLLEGGKGEKMGQL